MSPERGRVQGDPFLEKLVDALLGVHVIHGRIAALGDLPVDEQPRSPSAAEDELIAALLGAFVLSRRVSKFVVGAAGAVPPESEIGGSAPRLDVRELLR